MQSKENHLTLLELLLEEQNNFVSGERISQKLGISRTAVWKQVKKLEALGYELEAVTKLGYRLKYIPSPINIEELKKKLEHHRYGSTIHYFKEVDSTQIVAKQIAEEGAPEGTLVLAEQQNQGKGRLGRKWHSPYGKGIWMSIVLRPKVPIQLAPQLTLLTAVALCQSVRELTALDVGIKWPNDLLIAGHKISGILLESTAEDQMLKYVIAGIGIDANLSEQDYDEELREKATSLRLASGQVIDRSSLIISFLHRYEALMNQYEQEGFLPIAEKWEELAISFGKKVNLTTPYTSFVGTPLRLTEAGSIVVQLEDGTEKEIFSADMGEVSN